MARGTISREELGYHVLTASGTFRSVRPLAISLLVALVAIEIFFLIFGESREEAADSFPLVLLIYLAGVGFMAIVIRYIGRVGVYSKGIEGRSFGGFRRRLLWDNIAGARKDGSSGVLMLVLIEKATGKELYMLAEIAEREDFQMAIRPYVEWRNIDITD